MIVNKKRARYLLEKDKKMTMFVNKTLIKFNFIFHSDTRN